VDNRINGIRSFLGMGSSFPLRFNKLSHEVEMVFDLEGIEENIRMISGTYPNERILQPKFGSCLRDRAFEIKDEELFMWINEEIKRVMLNFESRINFIGAEV
jgi:uncharacterized protein